MFKSTYTFTDLFQTCCQLCSSILQCSCFISSGYCIVQIYDSRINLSDIFQPGQLFCSGCQLLTSLCQLFTSGVQCLGVAVQGCYAIGVFFHTGVQLIYTVGQCRKTCGQCADTLIQLFCSIIDLNYTVGVRFQAFGQFLGSLFESQRAVCQYFQVIRDFLIAIGGIVHTILDLLCAVGCFLHTVSGGSDLIKNCFRICPGHFLANTGFDLTQCRLA